MSRGLGDVYKRQKYTHEDELDKEFAEINDRLDIEIANTLKKEEF